MDPEMDIQAPKKRKRRHKMKKSADDVEPNVRGQTVKHDLNKGWNGVKVEVGLDEHGVPINRKVRKDFASWAGTQVKANVPLAEWPTWPKVDKRIKDDVWEGLLVILLLSSLYSLNCFVFSYL